MPRWLNDVLAVPLKRSCLDGLAGAYWVILSAETAMTTLQLRRFAPRAFALVGLTACAATGLTDTKGGISSSDAAVIATQFSKAMGNGALAAHTALAPAGLGARGASSLSAANAMPLVNVQISQRTNCAAGGYINVSGSLTGSISNNGTGALSFGVTETINDWQCFGAFIFNGDPYLSAAGTFSFLSGVLSSPASISMGGGFKWTGNGGGSCTLQLTALVYSNGTGHTSGQVCGQQVDVRY